MVSTPADVLSLMRMFETKLLIAGISWKDIQDMGEEEIMERVAAISVLEEMQQQADGG